MVIAKTLKTRIAVLLGTLLSIASIASAESREEKQLAEELPQVLTSIYEAGNSSYQCQGWADYQAPKDASKAQCDPENFYKFVCTKAQEKGLIFPKAADPATFAPKNQQEADAVVDKLSTKYPRLKEANENLKSAKKANNVAKINEYQGQVTQEFLKIQEGCPDESGHMQCPEGREDTDMVFAQVAADRNKPVIKDFETRLDGLKKNLEASLQALKAQVAADMAGAAAEEEKSSTAVFLDRAFTGLLDSAKNIQIDQSLSDEVCIGDAQNIFVQRSSQKGSPTKVTLCPKALEKGADHPDIVAALAKAVATTVDACALDSIALAKDMGPTLGGLYDSSNGETNPTGPFRQCLMHGVDSSANVEAMNPMTTEYWKNLPKHKNANFNPHAPHCNQPMTNEELQKGSLAEQDGGFDRDKSNDAVTDYWAAKVYAGWLKRPTSVATVSKRNFAGQKPLDLVVESYASQCRTPYSEKSAFVSPASFLNELVGKNTEIRQAMGCTGDVKNSCDKAFSKSFYSYFKDSRDIAKVANKNTADPSKNFWGYWSKYAEDGDIGGMIRNIRALDGETGSSDDDIHRAKAPRIFDSAKASGVQIDEWHTAIQQSARKLSDKCYGAGFFTADGTVIDAQSKLNAFCDGGKDYFVMDLNQGLWKKTPSESYGGYTFNFSCQRKCYCKPAFCDKSVQNCDDPPFCVSPTLTFAGQVEPPLKASASNNAVAMDLIEATRITKPDRIGSRCSARAITDVAAACSQADTSGKYVAKSKVDYIGQASGYMMSFQCEQQCDCKAPTPSCKSVVYYPDIGKVYSGEAKFGRPATQDEIDKAQRSEDPITGALSFSSPSLVIKADTSGKLYAADAPKPILSPQVTGAAKSEVAPSQQQTSTDSPTPPPAQYGDATSIDPNSSYLKRVKEYDNTRLKATNSCVQVMAPAFVKARTASKNDNYMETDFFCKSDAGKNFLKNSGLVYVEADNAGADKFQFAYQCSYKCDCKENCIRAQFLPEKTKGPALDNTDPQARLADWMFFRGNLNNYCERTYGPKAASMANFGNGNKVVVQAPIDHTAPAPFTKEELPFECDFECTKDADNKVSCKNYKALLLNVKYEAPPAKEPAKETKTRLVIGGDEDKSAALDDAVSECQNYAASAFQTDDGVKSACKSAKSPAFDHTMTISPESGVVSCNVACQCSGPGAGTCAMKAENGITK